jgi:hypothetical protein
MLFLSVSCLDRAVSLFCHYVFPAD